MVKDLLIIADWAFIVFHTTLVVFNMVGWAWRSTRRWNLITLALTGFSWLFIGLLTGKIGYCICTDWHWQVRRALELDTTADTYIQFLVEVLTGYRPSLIPTQWVSGIAFVS